MRSGASALAYHLTWKVPMTIWNVDGVDGEPEITLVRWRILETDESDQHLVGAREDDFTGRVSTAITTFDPSRMVGSDSLGTHIPTAW
jgi:hypothetical protein